MIEIKEIFYANNYSNKFPFLNYFHFKSTKMQKYGEKDYWDHRYECYGNENFDWLEDFESLEHIITALC